jgi:hypothetical protein
MPDGVTVAQQTLDLFVLVQIQVGQPTAICDFGFTIYDFHWLANLSFRAFAITDVKSLNVSIEPNSTLVGRDLAAT